MKFHNGKTLTADDVVASFRQYLNQKTSQILSALPASMIEPSGVVKTGPYSVQFRLKAPNNAFPYLVSQTTYQAIIQPAAIAAEPDTWVSSGMIGTGPFRLKSQNKQRAELVRFNNYWGGKPPLDRVVITFYTDPAPMVLALRGGQLDVVVQMSPQQSRSFKNNSKYRVYTVPVSSHNMFGLARRHATRSRTLACGAQSRSRSIGPTSSTGSCSEPAPSATIRRSSTDSRRPSRDPAAQAEPRSRPGRF